jgi:hypothetical protein
VGMTHSMHQDNWRSTARAGQPRANVHELAAGAILGVPIQRRARVTCLTGELWVTGPDTDDQILEPGQSLSIRGSGRLVVEALSTARFETLA